MADPEGTSFETCRRSKYSLSRAAQVTDLDPTTSFTGQLTDTSQVDKFELSETEYAQRQGAFANSIDYHISSSSLPEDSVLAYKQRHKIGRFADQAAEEPVQTEPEAVDIPVGARCEIETTVEDFKKRGTVRYVGTTDFAKGAGVGVEYDEPFGKNDGS